MFDFFKKLFGKKCENCKDGVCQCNTEGKCGAEGKCKAEGKCAAKPEEGKCAAKPEGSCAAK